VIAALVWLVIIIGVYAVLVNVSLILLEKWEHRKCPYCEEEKSDGRGE
jgi:hypothetical protein